MKKFYIVKDETDLLSGNIIPKKVLNYMPGNSFGNFSNFSNFNPVFQPIRKSSELVINPASSIKFSPLSATPVYSPFHNPVTVTKAIMPLPLQGSVSSCGSLPSNNCSSNVLPVKTLPLNSSCGVSSCSSTILPFPRQTSYFPPIVKLSPMINAGIGGTVKIISPTTTYSINVPAMNMRSVVNDIYLNSQTNLNPLEQKITFRIITPTIDSSLQTTQEKMLEIVKMINNKYSNLTYLSDSGKNENLAILLDLLTKKQLY